jgi:hypothetical protein
MSLNRIADTYAKAVFVYKKNWAARTAAVEVNDDYCF